MKIDRLIGIVVMLLNRGKVTAGEMADHYEVSERTIYRDIDALCRAGIPVITMQGSGGGIALMEGFVIDGRIVDRNDISAIVTALRGLSSVFDDDSYAETREKVESLVPNAARNAFNHEQAKISVDMVPWGWGDEYRQKLNTLKHGIDESRLITFRYGNAKGEIIERTVEPHSLHFKGFSWYLFAFCKLRNDFRLFKFSRITNIRPLTERFVPREDADSKLLALEPTIDPRRRTAITVLMDPHHRARAEETFGIENITETSRGLEISVVWPEDDWVYGFLLSFGPSLTVLSPQRVRTIMAKKARQIAENYKKGTKPDTLVSYSVCDDQASLL